MNAAREEAALAPAGAGCREASWSEADRLAALDRYAVLDSGREAAFDEVAELAADLFDAPIAVVNFIAADRQWFKAEKGIGQDSLPLDVSICRHAILQQGVFVVPDLAEDARFEHNPLVAVAGGLRFYAGALLETPDGLPLGTVCVLDTEPRPGGISTRQERALKALAVQTMAQLEQRRALRVAEAEKARADAQNRVLALAMSDAPFSDTLATIVTAVEELSSSGVLASILLLDEDGKHLRHGAAPHLPAAYNAAIDGIEIGPKVGSCGTAAFSKSPVFVADIAADPLWADFRDLALDHGMRSCWSLPILSRHGAVLGTFAIYHREVRAPSEDDLAVVDFVVRTAALVIEQEHAVRARRTSEERYRQIVESAEDFAIITLDAHGIVTGWNSGARNIVGHTADEAIGQPGAIIFTPEDREAGAPDHELARALSDGRAVDDRLHLRKDGSSFWGSGLMMPLGGNGDGFLKIFRDRTNEHEAEAALRSSEARLRFLRVLDDRLAATAKASVAMKAATELLGQQLDASRCAYADVGSDDDQFVIRGDYNAPGIASSAGSYSLDLFGDIAATKMRAGETLIVRDVVRELDAGAGRETFQSIGISAIICCPLVKDGHLVAMMAVHQDRPRDWSADEIALVQVAVEHCWAQVERVAAEERLRESEERLRLAVENAEVGFWDVDEVNDTLIWPARTKAMFGISAETPASMQDFYDGLHPDDRERTSAAYAAAADPQLRALYDVEYRTVGKEDGQIRWVAAKGRGIFDERGRCLRVVGTAIEITQRKAIEERLRELNETLERRVAEASADLDRVWSNATDMFVVVDGEGTFRRVNPATMRILGWSQAEMLGRRVFDFIHPDDLPATLAALEHARGDDLPAFVNRYRAKDGDYRSISWVASPEGALIYGYGRDVTLDKQREAELEAAQDALRQAQKMEAMGQLTGGVAHDFNNLLTPIVGSLDMLQRQGLGGEREQRLIAGAAQSADRAKTLVQRLLAFARRQPLQPVPVDVGKLIAGMGDLVASTTGPQIKVVVDAPTDLPAAKADPNQLEMALLNLAVNARDAMPDGGTLRISAGVESIASGHRSQLRPGEYVRLSVADTGQGMDETTRARAVEPFFSTKGIGKGTGLGLSMVHGLASQLGGALTIQSRPGLGTNVELWVPRTSGVPSSSSSNADRGPVISDRGTALLVEDEELVRVSTADMLTDLGYTVVEASSAEEALGLIEAGERFDLVVTDHLMPGMSGSALAQALRSIKPDLPVLLVSGYAEREGADLDLPRLVKPFRKDELAASLAQLSTVA